MSSRIRKWVDNRIPVDKIFNSFLDEKIPGGASFFYTLGSATLFVFILQIVTGIWQLFYYVPTIDHAYDSITYLQLYVPFGWLIHGLHYWGANVMAILVGLHILRVFIWGAYKKPRELTWLFGVLLLFLTIGMIFTGAVLPWDERGYWAAEVGTSIAGTVPFIGNGLINLLLGGQKIGQLALSRFFILHAAIIPVIAIIMIGIHLMAFRKFGSAGPWSGEKRSRQGDFWPDQINKDVIVISILFLVLVTLAAFRPPPFTGPADPLDATFVPKPEWNFLFLYEALKFFPGFLEIIATVGIPALILFLFISIPFLDKGSDRNPLKRLSFTLGGSIFVILLLSLTIIGYNSSDSADQAQTKLKVPVVKQAKLSADILKGKQIFTSNGCTSCHEMNGKGGQIGPNLTMEFQKGRTKDWIMIQIKNSKAHYPGSIMPSYAMLNEKQLSNLADFLLNTKSISNNFDNVSTNSSLSRKSEFNNPGETSKFSLSIIVNNHKIPSDVTVSKDPGPAANMIGNIAHGALLFQQDCVSCHGAHGKGGIPNPGSTAGYIPALNPISKNLYDKNPQIFANNIDKFIQHGSVPPGPSPAIHMIDYGDSYTLTQQQIANIEAYILSINGINRAELQVNSLSPAKYYLVVAGVFILTSLFFMYIGFIKREKE